MADDSRVEVELVVGGHSVIVRAAEPLDVVTAAAMDLFRQTQEPARAIPFGFDVAGGQFELASGQLAEECR